MLDESVERVLVVNPTRSYWSIGFTCEAALQSQHRGIKTLWLNVPTIVKQRAETLHANHHDAWKRSAYRDPSVTAAQILSSEGVSVLLDSPGCLIAEADDEFTFSSISELEALEWHGIEVGALASAAVSGLLKIRFFDIEVERQRIQGHLMVAKILIPIFESVLDSFKPDMVITTNDRLLPSALALAVARNAGIPGAVIYWSPASVDKYVVLRDSLYRNSSWRELAERFEQEQERNPGFEASARETAQRHVAEGVSDSQQFRMKMRRGRLPARSSNRRRFAIFPGSPWEYSGVRYEEPPKFRSQYEACEYLVAKLDPQEWEVLIRHHPPGRDGVDRAEVSAWSKIREFPHVCEIEPESTIDSYELAESADFCGIWDSSIGLELALRGMPVCVMDDVLWLEDSSPAYCRTPEEVDRYLRNPSQISWHERDLIAATRFIHVGGYLPDFTRGLGTDLLVCDRQVFRPRLRFISRDLQRRVRRLISRR